MSNVLGVHVIGLGFGESILIEMPNGGVGVIDCFAPRLQASTREERLGANPTLRFLINDLKAERLAFVAFSHSHEDHGRGLSHLLEEFRGRIDAVWVFRAFQSIDLERHMLALLCGGRRLDVETLRNEPAGTFTRELSTVNNLVLDLTRKTNPDAARLREFAGYKKFTIEGEPLTFHMIGPTDRLVAEYERSLAENMTGLVDDSGERVKPEWRPDQINHNRVSAALVVEYGKTRFLLGADMETQAWESVLGEIDGGTDYDLSLSCHFVKVSHHGSISGHCPGLYEHRFRRRSGKPIAILTPFNRHRHPLPSGEGVDHLLAHANAVWTTNSAEAYRASGRLPAEGVSPPHGEPGEVSIPLSWAGDITANPDLRGALRVSESEGPEIAVPPVAIPVTWQRDLIANPRLAGLLRPEFRRQLITDDDVRSIIPERDCRVSFYFNDKGRELNSRRYVGSRAGRIT